jgi:hypothetical protein
MKIERDDVAQEIELARLLGKPNPERYGRSRAIRFAIFGGKGGGKGGEEAARQVSLSDVDAEPPAATIDYAAHFAKIESVLSQLSDTDRACVLLWAQGESDETVCQLRGLSPVCVRSKKARLARELPALFAA